jgi:hypothetical protein
MGFEVGEDLIDLSAIDANKTTDDHDAFEVVNWNDQLEAGQMKIINVGQDFADVRANLGDGELMAITVDFTTPGGLTADDFIL